MSTALRIYQGKFGRVALLDMDKPLIVHAHPHCHVLIKADGADTSFLVRETPQPLREDTAVLVNAWEPHSYTHFPGAPRTIILALYIEPRWLAEIQADLLASAAPRFFAQPCVEITPRVRALADRLALEMLHGADGSTHESLLFELMIAVVDQFSEWRSLRSMLKHGAPRPATDYRIRRAIERLRAHVGSDVPVDALAQEVGLSRAHFFRLFREETHLTPHVYLNVLRFEAAVSQLTRSDQSLATLSDSLGFSEQGHFTRFFRNHLGITPSEYRRVVNLVDRAQPAA